MIISDPNAKSWLPPFCPNPRCDFHADPTGWRFHKKGFYHRDARPRRIQRYRCTRCGRCFSSQTFSTTYWLRRPDVVEPIVGLLLSCSGFRQAARRQASRRRQEITAATQKSKVQASAIMHHNKKDEYNRKTETADRLSQPDP